MGLTDEQTTIIKATVPILETGGETLTKHFYSVMLTEYPEVVPFFNKTHQASGDQPRALAHAVLMYAKNIDRLQNLGPLAGQIVNKHVSLAVKAEHYPIVGACLLRAIREVLGAEIASDAVLDAWAAAYKQLADMLIGAEEQVYQTHAAAKGGWRDERSFILTKKISEAEDIMSFYFAPADKQDILHYEPGQYTCIRVPDLNGQDIRRNYSLSQVHPGYKQSSDNEDEEAKEYRITVKRDMHGVMSRYLHDTLSVGDAVSMLPPAGSFTFQSPPAANKPVVFIAGGIGITPLLTMIQHALLSTTTVTDTRDLTLIYCCRSPAAQAFTATLNALAETHQHRFRVFNWYTREGSSSRRWNVHDLYAMFPESVKFSGEIDNNATTTTTTTITTGAVEVYFTAPKDMMVDLKRMLVSDMGIAPENLHYECFGPTVTI